MRIFRLPSAPKQYSEAAENKFRRELEQALQNASNETGGAVQPASVGTSAVKASITGQARILDASNAVVLDTTGPRRILAVPVQPLTDSGASLSIDLSTGQTQQVRLTATNSTLTLLNPMDGGRYRIWFQQDETGSRLFPTISDIVMFTNDTPPTLTTTPGALDLFEFEYRVSPTKRYTCATIQTNVLLPSPQNNTGGNGALNTVFPNGAVASHAINLPATVVAGELLLLQFVYRNVNTISTAPSGWTQVAKDETQNPRLVVYAKVSDGTEGGSTATIVLTDNSPGFGQEAAAQVYRIGRWFGALSGVAVTTFAAGNSIHPDSSSLTPGWTDRDLWLTLFGQYTLGSATQPTNYTNTVLANSGGSVTIGCSSAYRTLYAAAEDPGQWTTGNATLWVALTVAVRPPA